MATKGFLLFVLHTHQPFVAQPNSHIEYGEQWLYEVITESYIPLLDMCQRFMADGVAAKLTFSLTPTLTAMLSNSLVQRKYLSYVDERIFTLETALRQECAAGVHTVQRMHLHRFQRARDFFERLFQSDLCAVFWRLQEDGLISLLASAATHAYLPVWQALPEAVKLQIAVGTECYRRLFRQAPRGFWLPECGFYPGVDWFLREAGIKYFFVDGHALLNARPRPLHGIRAPVHTAAGLAALARDAIIHDQVWRNTGYPGEPAYLASQPDPLLGIRLCCSDAAGNPYNPARAQSRCIEHARHFVSQCRERVQVIGNQLGREPLIVATFDTEHFGHWWHEGPQWLDLVIRMIASEAPELSLITAEDYLRLYPSNQEVTPSMSSWGWQGYGETWLMGRNDWIYRELFQRFEDLQSFLRNTQGLSAAQRAAINQYLCEFLLAQSSDWAYMLHAQQNESFVRNKLQRCFANMAALLSCAERNHPGAALLEDMQAQNPIFSDTDLLSVYASLSPGPKQWQSHVQKY